MLFANDPLNLLAVDVGVVAGAGAVLDVGAEEKPEFASAKTTQDTTEPAPAPVKEALASSGSGAFQNGAEAAAAGVYNIPARSPAYFPRGRRGRVLDPTPVECCTSNQSEPAGITMHQKTIITALAFASGLALAGCSASDSQTQIGGSSEAPTASQTPSASPSPETMKLDQAFYAKTPYGSEITVDFSAPAPADIEEYRKAAGIDPGSYAKVDLDNRQGTDDVGIYKVVFYDEAGKSYEFDDVLDHMSEWQSDENYDSENPQYWLADGTPITEAQETALSRQYDTLTDKYWNTTSASRHEKTTGYIANAETKLPEDITAIEVWPGGIIEDPIYMTPVSEKDGYKVSDSSGGVDSQSDEEAMEEFEEWQSSGADCSDAALKGMGPKARLNAGLTCEFPEETETDADGGVGVGAPTTEPTQVTPDVAGPTADLSNDVVMPESFTYDEAYAAWQGGMDYYDAFCINYVPTTDGGRSQCEGIEAGTVDRVTGEYIGG